MRQLLELSDISQSSQPDYGDSEAAELLPDVRARVLSKIHEVIRAVCVECSSFDASEFDDFFRESN
jgi:hypothetical protein